eukprot:3497856-Prorocentrum_lima.AAC.1
MERVLLPRGYLHDEAVELFEGQVSERLLHLGDAGVLVEEPRGQVRCLSLIHISEPTRLDVI